MYGKATLNMFNHHGHPMICSFAALGPKQSRPKPEAKARIVTAMETAGSGADDKACQFC